MKWLLILGWVITGYPESCCVVGMDGKVHGTPAKETDYTALPKFIEMPSQETCLAAAKLNKDYQCWARVQ